RPPTHRSVSATRVSRHRVMPPARRDPLAGSVGATRVSRYRPFRSHVHSQAGVSAKRRPWPSWFTSAARRLFMQALVVRRLLLMLPLLVGMTLISFIVSHTVPADPVGANLGQRSMEDPAIVAAFRAQWGLDRPPRVH